MESPSAVTVADRPTKSGRILALVCIMALAVNLRAVAGSIGVSLEALEPALGMSGAQAGLLTTLPVLCFAGFGLVANPIARFVGLHRTAALSLAALTAGMIGRALVDSVLFFDLLTVIALSGAAVGNVILPPLVKLHFPDKVGPVTALYTSGVLLSSAIAPAVTVPIASGFGGWRAGLLAWGIAAGAGLLPWLGSLRHEHRGAAKRRATISFATAARSPMAWLMAVFFGVQSANAYVVLGWMALAYTGAGVSSAGAGLLVAMVQAIGIPIALLLPVVVSRLRRQTLLPIMFALLSAGGWIGLWLAPGTVSWLWALLLGLGCGAFPWVLLMIGMRTRSPAGTAALSGFAQSVGYLIAALGPLGVGLLRDATGSWTAPLLALAGSSMLLLLGVRFAAPRWFEDTLPGDRARRRGARHGGTDPA